MLQLPCALAEAIKDDVEIQMAGQLLEMQRLHEARCEGKEALEVIEALHLRIKPARAPCCA